MRRPGAGWLAAGWGQEVRCPAQCQTRLADNWLVLGAPLQTPTQPWLVPHCCNLVSNPPPTLPPSSALQQSGIRGEGGRCRHQSRARPLPEGGPGGSRRAQRPVTAGLVTCGGQPGSAPIWIACIMNWSGAASQQQRLYTTSGQSVPLASSNVHPHTVQQCTPTHIQTHTPTCKYISKSANQQPLQVEQPSAASHSPPHGAGGSSPCQPSRLRVSQALEAESTQEGSSLQQGGCTGDFLVAVESGAFKAGWQPGHSSSAHTEPEQKHH